MKKKLIIVGIILSVIMLISIKFITTNNYVVVLEEQINESSSSIKIQEKRRVDLLINLVDAVKSYNKYEQSTMTQIIEARSKAINGDVEDAKNIVNVIAEQYPDLKSNENYKQVMTEMAITENLIAEHRNNYNGQVKSYKQYTKAFPNNVILNILGYERQTYEYLDYEASSDAPTNLWD